ncbi:hypothetical protein ACTFIY_010791 [Dictyostelium cf. discoideum]
MGEYIYNVQEKIEIVNGEVLEERQKCMKNFIGLGPPDLCIISKQYEPPRFVPGLKTQKISSYHWTMGVNTGSTSAAAVYLGTILDNQEKSSFGRGNYKIEQCHLISYNAFLRMDLHLELPGTSNHLTPPITYSLNSNGEKNQIEETFWTETYLSSVLRYIQGAPPFLRPVKIIPNMLKDPSDENDFLKLCSQHYWEGRKLGGFDRELYIDFKNDHSTTTTTNTESMEIDDSNNLLVSTLSNYFLSRNRYLPMLNFFEELQKTEPTVSVPVSIAHRLLGNIDQSISILEKSLLKSPNSTSILIELSSTLLLKNNRSNNNHYHNNNNTTSPIITTPGSSNSPTSSSVIITSPTTTTNNTTTTTTTNIDNNSTLPIQKDETLLLALKYILKALSLKPGLIGAWEIASRIFIQMGLIEWALVFLNNTPNVQLDHATDRVGRGKYQKVTPPQENPNIINVLEDEEIEFDEEPGDEVLKRLSSNTLSGDSKKYFKILVSLFKKIGWIQLVDKKNKIIDELAIALRDKHKLENNKNNGSNNNFKKSNDINSNEIDGSSSVNITKDGHNSVSPLTKTTRATENTLNSSSGNVNNTHTDGTDGGVNNTNTNTDSGTEPPPPPQISEEPNVPKEVLWRDEDVTSDGSDIADDDLDKIDLESATSPENPTTTTTTTTTTSEPKIIRPEFDGNSITFENLSETLSNFIDNFGSESTKDKSKKQYISFEIEPNFNKVKLPISYNNRNLDMAFHSLFQDIKAYQGWKEEEEQKKINENIQISLKNINPNRTIPDWIRLARLAYRIGELGDAEKLFLKLISEDKSHPLVTLGLIKIFSDHGDIRNCIISSSQLSRYYSFKYKTLEMHPVIEKSILGLISNYGLQKVRNIFATLNDNSSCISGLFLDSVKWRSNGYDK